jgi:agmatinase
MKYLAAVAAIVGASYAHGHHDDQTPIEGPHQGLWYNQLPGDGGTQVKSATLVSIRALLTVAG